MSEGIDAGIRFLLVEDDPDDARLLESALRGSGLAFTCRRVDDEPAFRLELARYAPDLIVSDYSMPQFNGLDALRIARQEAPKTPFVFFSGTIGEERAIEALRNGAVDYVLKDHPLRLIPTVQRTLKQARERAALARMERIQEIFGQCVAPEVAERMLSYPEDVLAREELKVMTVLFMDLRQFTGYASRTEPREVVRSLNQVFELVAAGVKAEHGILSKFLGDGAMALFGAPVPQPDHAAAAARAAIRIRDSVDGLTAKRREDGLHPLALGLGINTGEVVAGVVGAHDRMEYTVIGHAVNMASRLEEAAGPGEILLGPDTAERLGPDFVVRKKDALRLAGIDRPVEPYELIASR
jgi:adenylate cyclase